MERKPKELYCSSLKLWAERDVPDPPFRAQADTPFGRSASKLNRVDIASGRGYAAKRHRLQRAKLCQDRPLLLHSLTRRSCPFWRHPIVIGIAAADALDILLQRHVAARGRGRAPRRGRTRRLDDMDLCRLTRQDDLTALSRRIGDHQRTA